LWLLILDSLKLRNKYKNDLNPFETLKQYKSNKGGDLMDRNTMIVLVVLIIAVVVVCIFALLWMYTPYMGGYHYGFYGNYMGPGMMHGY
jgi:hypothetical protein